MCTAGDVACLIAEPIQGVGGFATPPDGFFGAMKEVLDAHGILFIADEVQTGWGRTGEHFWGYQAHGIVPDLLTFAKGVGNGLALGGVVGPGRGRRQLPGATASPPSAATRWRAPARWPTSTTCWPTTCRATPSRWARCSPTALRAPADRHPFIAEVRGRGLMLAIELCVPGTDDRSAARAVAGRPRPRCWRRRAGAAC